jgi:hypothetical protein
LGEKTQQRTNKMKQTNQDKIDNILAKNTDENGLYPAEMRRLTPKDCNVGDMVLV